MVGILRPHKDIAVKQQMRLRHPDRAAAEEALLLGGQGGYTVPPQRLDDFFVCAGLDLQDIPFHPPSASFSSCRTVCSCLYRSGCFFARMSNSRD